MISKWRFALSHQPEMDLDDAPVHQPLESTWTTQWAPDRLLDGYETLTYTLADQPQLAEEGTGCLVSTLIRHHPPRHRRAVLHIHGWNEYFFQTHVAQFFEDLGYDFYAVDLHRYGRSLRDGELPGYVEDIRDYFEELDACMEVIRADHNYVVLSGHSTGGLTASLYASERPKTFVGVILNAPWIDMQGSAFFRALTPPVVRGLSMTSPTWKFPSSDSDLYGRSLHVKYHGEWDYDLSLKRIESQPSRPGWIKAILNGHDRVAAGLRIDCPVLVLTSARSSDPKQWGEECTSTDLALDVDRIAARVHLLGWHTTLVRLSGALHDVSLSKPEIRARFFDEIRRWELAYVRSRSAQDKTAAELGQE